MDLIDRYLHAVREYLTGTNRDDIVRELGDDLRARAADREEELGRPLTADDQAGLLKPFGHPLLLAAKYRPTQHLVSPVLFPFYWLGLKISIGIAITVQVGMAIAMVATGTPGGQVIGRLAAFPFTGLVTLFGWITLGFAVVDVHVRHVVTRATDAWDPRKLGDQPTDLLSKVPWSSAAELAFGTIALLWWVAIPRQPWLVFGPAASFLAMAPAWQAVHMPLAVVWLAGLAVRWALLFRPDLKGLRFAFDVVSNVVAVLVAAYFLHADAIVVQAAGTEASLTPEQLGRLVRSIDASAHIGALVWLLVAAWELVRTVWNRRVPG